MRSMKGISPIVTYVFAVLLALIVIAGTTVLGYNFYDVIIQDQIKRDLTQVSAQTSAKITELYSVAKASKASPDNSSAILLADVDLNLPDKVADRGYSLVLVAENQVSTLVSEVTVNDLNISTSEEAQTGKIIASTTEEPFLEVEYSLPSIDIDIQGRTGDPGNATLRYYRYNPNGTVVDTVLMGDFTILGQVISAG